MELGEGFAARLRELRTAAGLTQAELARACQRAGLTHWSDGRIGALEASPTAPTIQTIMGVALGLSLATGQDVRLSDFFPEEGSVRLGGEWSIPFSWLRAALAGRSVRSYTWHRPLPKPEDTPGWGGADAKAVEETGQDPWIALAAAQELWGHTVTVERDQRAGPEATPQKRGRITRALIAELRPVAERMARESAET